MPRTSRPTTSPVSVDEVAALIAELVRIPSRGGIDSYQPIFDFVAGWLTKQGISHRLLRGAGDKPVALAGTLEFGEGTPVYLLNATLDTAPFGDESQWTDPPLSGVVRNGWLYGRGSADSKAGVAIFMHLLAALARQRTLLRGRLCFLFDADEHSGDFTGVKTFVEDRALVNALQGIYIGYPGNDRVIIGSRGFERARLIVHGTAAHSGASQVRGINAVERAAKLIQHLASRALPSESDPEFALPPKLTITGVRGGEGFSSVPDTCVVDVDVRLTPHFTVDDARELLADAAAWLDETAPGPSSTQVEGVAGWPAYRIAADDPLVNALQQGSIAVTGRRLPTLVAGPSNVGNLFATLGKPSTAGFGARYQNLHGADECVEIATLQSVIGIYHVALQRLLAR